MTHTSLPARSASEGVDVSPRWRFGLVGLVIGFMLSFGSPIVRAADNDAKVNDAIAKGARYLAGRDYSNIAAGHGIGTLGLVGLALMEADEAGYQSAIKSLAQAIRVTAVTETGTYQVALAIIFLDRHANPADVGLVQILGARLMASQSMNGGWGYACSGTVEGVELARIRSSLNGVPATKTQLNSVAAAMMTAIGQGQRNSASVGGTDDNSNTQFATVALWVARRNGIAVDPALFRLQARYLRSQSTANGGWGYVMNEAASSPSMSCAGMLSLAAAKAAAESPTKPGKAMPEEGKKPEADDPFSKPPVSGDVREEDPNDPEPPPAVDTTVLTMRDKAIERGLTGLGQLLQNAGSIGGGGGNFGGTDDLYFYWSLERVAVAFGLDTVGGVDWYKWGCDAILPAQQANGAWPSHYDDGPIGTAFALLFLKKANFTADLSRQIKNKIKDPGSGELRGGRGVGPSGIPETGSPLNRKPGEDPKAAKINKVRPTTEGDKIAAALVSATDREWPSRLTAAKETRGAHNTQGIVTALGTLEGKRLYQAREALAERLTRMTADTLKSMLSDRDAELRRAACLAVGMKDDWTLLPDVIDRVTDPNDIVVRAAKATLKAISNEDHGPKSGATDTEKRTAADAWRFWYAKAIREKR